MISLIVIALALGCTTTKKPREPKKNKLHAYINKPNRYYQIHPKNRRLVIDRKAVLSAHNNVRWLKSLPPLEWDEDLENIAASHAYELTGVCTLRHNTRKGLGENLAMTPISWNSRRVVRMWALEEKNYDYKNNRCIGICGHYTQLVWKTTKFVGCAISECKGYIITVCNYSPPGNWIGRRPY